MSAIKAASEAKAAEKARAIERMDSTYFETPDVGAREKIERFDIKAAFALSEEKDYSKANRYIDSLISICENNINERYFAEKKVAALYTKGTIYYSGKDFDEALNYFALSRRTGEQLHLSDCSYLGYSGTADLLFRQENYLAAAAQFRENYRIEQSCRQDPWLKFVYSQGNLNSMGMCYERAGKLDSAGLYYDSAAHYISREGRLFPSHQAYVQLATAVVEQGLGSVSEKNGATGVAERFYLKSIEGTREQYIEFTNRTKLRLAALYVKNDLLQKAFPILEELDTGMTIRDKYLLEFYRLQARYAAKKNDLAGSNLFLQKALILSDELMVNLKALAAIDISSEFKMKEQQMINTSLADRNRAQSFKLSIFIVLSVLCVLVILLIWYHLNRTAGHLKQLRNLNHVIQLRNDQLQKAFTSIEESQEQNKRISRMIMHDVKNPISGVSMLVTGLLKQDFSEDVKHSLSLIHDASTLSNKLIDQVMIESNASQAERETVDIKELIEYSVELLKTKANEKKQEIRMVLNPCKLPLNRQQIWRVISNLVHNAIKFSPEHSVILIQGQKREGDLLITVKDKGIGIPTNLQDKIWLLHPDASRPGTNGERSFGLGLSIAMQIVKDHGGKLWFESIDGRGTTFFVELPLSL